MKKSWIAGVLIALVTATCPASRVAAQAVYAAVHGTVTDATGAVVPGASVAVTNTSTGITTRARTDKSGYYIFPQLQAGGPYTVMINAAGFQAFASKGMTLNVNDNRDVNAKLAAGSFGETVEVSANAVQVETSNTQLQQIVTADQLEQIPLEGRDPAGLQKLEPGVMESSDRLGSFSSNGTQTAQNSYLVNGIDINDPLLGKEGIQINPDALAEENIVTSTMNPEFARNSGTVVNQVLKSGTNKLHGSGFEFYRDTFMTNGNYFTLPGTPRPQFHQNLYGGTLGGPLVKDKLFFFAAYQGLRQRSGLTTNQVTLSTAQLAGQFSADRNYGTGLNDNTPQTVTIGGVDYTVSDGLSTHPMPFAYGGCAAGTPWALCFNNGGLGAATVTVPRATWNSAASRLTSSFVPAANNIINGVPYYNFNAGVTSANDQGIARLDYTPSSRDSIWATGMFQSSPQTSQLSAQGGSFPGFGSTQGDHFKLFGAAWTHTFNAHALNELRAAYFRNPFAATFPSQIVAPSSYGFGIVPQDPASGLPFISLTGYFNLGFSSQGPQPRLDTNLTYADNVTLVRGNHNIKFGGQFEQFRVRNPFDVFNNGDFGFGGQGQYSSGDPLLDFALGIPDSYLQSSNGFVNAVATEWFAYVQDNWKVSRDLTLNFGASWDIEAPWQNHQFGGTGIICYNPSAAGSGQFPGAPPGLLFPGDPGCNLAGGVPTRYDHVAPRVGFAYSPSSGWSRLLGEQGAHQFSIRGGFGVYFDRDQEEQALQNLQDPPNFFVSRGAGDVGGSPSFVNPFADVSGNAGLSEANPFPYAVPRPGAAINWANYAEGDYASFDPSYNVPYTFNFNLNVQRALGRTMVAQVGYVGSLSRRLATFYEADPITAAGHAACLSNASCRGRLANLHLFYPQYTANPAVVPGSAGGPFPSGVPWYLSDDAQTTEGSSNYNSFQASLIKSPSHGLQFTLAYTYAHSLDDASGYESSAGAGGRLYNFVPGFHYLDYGNSDFDARQRFVASYVYEVPAAGMFRKNFLLRETLTGWQVAGITALQTGFPVSIGQSTISSGWCDAFSYFGCPDVPQVTSFSPSILNPRSAGHAWFSTAGFSHEPLGTFGNTPRNYFHGPGFNYTNLEVAKNFHVSSDGRRYIQLRLEAFNAFNHANFANPAGNFDSPSFGTITRVRQSAEPNGDPSPGRAVQLAGKLYF